MYIFRDYVYKSLISVLRYFHAGAKVTIILIFSPQILASFGMDDYIGIF
jgi:hypothetical protein